MRYACIARYRGDFPVRLMCRVLCVSSSGYYAWQRRAPSARARRDQALRLKVRVVHAKSRRRYGAPRVHAELKAQGERVARGLGFSPSRARSDAIGEKGHGTKIYLRSERVLVKTQCADGSAHESLCEFPMRALHQERLHSPRIREIEQPLGHSGTYIRIEGYNNNERSRFIQGIVKDYILWFTKVGSVERAFGIETHAGFSVHLCCLDRDDFEEIAFGHVFPDESPDIEHLFQQYGSDAADYYVNRYLSEDRLERHPEVQYQAIISVEGDRIKRRYNPMIRDRGRRATGRYKVADRYGIWLCKDFIPVMRVNEWITGFGSGSNAFVLLHGFINCQSLSLTANRGSISNTDPLLLDEIRETVQRLLDDVDADLNKKELYTLLQWQHEERTLGQEQAEFARRVKSITRRKVLLVNGQTILEPSNESELFGTLMRVYAQKPELFEFDPLDYNTTRGIDIIARNRSDNRIADSEHWYIELKFLLKPELNHAFRHIRVICCWDFDPAIREGSEFHCVEEADVRTLEVSRDDACTRYFLNSPRRQVKIEILRLREFLKQRLGVEAVAQTRITAK